MGGSSFRPLMRRSFTPWRVRATGGQPVEVFLGNAEVVEVNCPGDLVGGLPLHARHDVAVAGQGESRIGVAEPLADHSDRDTGLHRDRCVRVSQIVQSDPREI